MLPIWGDDAAQYESLIAEVAATYTPPAPLPKPVPQQVTMRQARLELLARDLLDDVEAVIASASREAQIEWEYAAIVERGAQWVGNLSDALGLTDEQLDQLFTQAANL